MVKKDINSFRISWRERVPNCISSSACWRSSINFLRLFPNSYCLNHESWRISNDMCGRFLSNWHWLKTASWVQFVAACEMNAKILPIQTALCIGTVCAFDHLFKTSSTWYAFPTMLYNLLLFSAYQYFIPLQLTFQYIQIMTDLTVNFLWIVNLCVYWSN